ncbi:MAG: FrgA protein [Myxococcaceae bacterium]|nr:FrgA protein [Myxococcaceae bacterium]
MAQRLAQHLLAKGLVSARLVDEALKRAERSKTGLDTALLALNAISEAGVLQAISDVSGIRLVNLSDFEPNAEAGPLMPYKMSKQLGVVPLSLDGQTLHVACAYPVPTSQLKDVGFLLGRKLELWVALEARVRDWQSVIYGQPLEPAVAAVLKQLDPSRPAPRVAPPEDERPPIHDNPPLPEKPLLGSETDSLSIEVVERELDGLSEKPLLLTTPKKKKKRIEVVDEPSVVVTADAVPLGEGEEHHTTVLDPTAYSRFARGGDDSGAQPVPLDEHDSTRVLDLKGYANFAKQLSTTEGQAANALVFPGGVLPPRTSAPPPPPPVMPPVAFLQPASPARPPPEKVELKADAKAQPQARQKPAKAPLPPPPHAHPTPPEPRPLGATSARVDETDFSDVNAEVLHATKSPGPQVPPEPPPVLPSPSRPQPSFTGATAVPSAPLPAARHVVPLTGPYSQVEPEPTPHAPLPPPPVEAPAQEAWSVPPPGASPVWQSSAALAASQPVYPAPPGLAPSSAMEWTLAQARQSLKDYTHDRDALINVVLEYGRRAFDFVAAFAVVRGAAVGWDSRGDGDNAAVRRFAVPLDTASVFRTVALTRGSYVGPLPPDALTQHYLAILGRAPRTVFLWPIEVQSKLVAMLYGDCGSNPVSQRRLSDFILFCRDLPTSFHDLILFRKQNPRAPQAFAERQEPAHEPIAPGISDVPTDAEWFNGLIALLTGPDPSERSMAMLELMKTPEASAAALAHAFPGPSAWSRLPVVELPEPDELGPIPGALTRLGHPAATAIAPLLDSSDSDARYLALLTAGSLRYPEVIDGVLRGLFDLEPDISSAARAAATSLRYLPTFQARLHELRRELASTDPLRRSLAARALGVLHDREAIDGLINLTGSEDELVATSAAEALKEITRANHGPNPRGWTAWYARARSLRRLEWLLDALASDEFDLRLSAIEELSRVFGDNYGFFADGPPAERLAALEQWQAVVASRPDLDI